MMRSEGISTVSTPFVQWMVDEEGVFILSEGDGLASLDLTPGEVVGKSVYDVYADVPEILESVRSALKGQVVEETLELSNTVWECRYFPVWNSNGEVSGVVGSAFNITAQWKRVLEQEILADFAKALRCATTRAEMPPIILDKLSAVLNTENIALITRSPNNGTVSVELARGFWRVVKGTPLSDEIHLWLTRNSEQIIAENTPYLDNEFSQMIDEMVSVAGIPLITQEAEVGVLWIGRKAPITNDDIHLLTAIGDMIANALHRAAQHEQTERRLQRIAALHAIDQAITSSLDLQVTLSILLEQVIRQLEVDAADVFLHDSQLRMLTFSDGRGFKLNSSKNVSAQRLGEGLAGNVALKRQLVSIPNLSQTEQAILRNSMLKEEGFVAYYGMPLIAKGKLKGVLEIFHRKPLIIGTEWIDFLRALATQAAIAIDNAELFEDIQRSNVELNLAYIATLEGWVRALDLRDKETERQPQRLTRRTVKLARAMGMSEEELMHIQRGALLHDIGKLGIPDEILNKPGPLTDYEWDYMRMHPTYAYELLREIEFLRPALDIPYSHHEKWDGTGYPQGLKGDQIPLAARIFAVMDVWDALSCDRSYRQAWPEEEVIEYIIGQTGKHFDPRVVEAWRDVFEIQIH